MVVHAVTSEVPRERPSGTSDPSVDIESRGSMESHSDSHDARPQSRGFPRAGLSRPALLSTRRNVRLFSEPSHPSRVTGHSHTTLFLELKCLQLLLCLVVSCALSFIVRMAFGKFWDLPQVKPVTREKQKPDFWWMCGRVNGSRNTVSKEDHH